MPLYFLFLDVTPVELIHGCRVYIPYYLLASACLAISSRLVEKERGTRVPPVPGIIGPDCAAEPTPTQLSPKLGLPNFAL